MASTAAQTTAEEREGLEMEFQSSVLLTHPRTLFLQVDGSPIRFYLAPGPWKRLLAPLILHGGGVMCRLRAAGAIFLAPPGHGDSSGTDAYVSALFVTDCVRAGELLDLAPYRLRNSSRPKVPCCYHELVSGPPVTGRTPFTRAEDLAILLYLRDHLAPGATATGNSVWKEMGRVHLTRHSWQAMQARYLKKLRGCESAYQLEARTLIPTLVYPHCGTCRPNTWSRGAEENGENCEAETSIGAPGEVNITDTKQENRFREPLGERSSEDQLEGNGIEDEDRGEGSAIEGKVDEKINEDLLEEGQNTEVHLEENSNRHTMKGKSKTNVNAPWHPENEMAVCNSKKQKSTERTEGEGNARGLVVSTMQITAESASCFLKSNTCMIGLEMETRGPRNRAQVIANVDDDHFGILQQGRIPESGHINTPRCDLGVPLGCLNTSVIGKDKIDVERKCRDQAAITSVVGVFSSSDKCTVSFTGDGEFCAPLVSDNGDPPQFQKAKNSEEKCDGSSPVKGDKALQVANMESSMFITPSKWDGCEPLDEDDTDKDDIGSSEGIDVKRAMQSCTVPRAEFEKRDFPVEDEDSHCFNLPERVDDIPESMESNDEESLNTKWRKHAPECENEDLEVIQVSGPIRQRKKVWYIGLESGEDEELQIKRRMKSTPVKKNAGAFKKANTEFQAKRHMLELVVPDFGQNKPHHRSPPSPTKQISVSKKPALEEYSTVTELESFDGNVQCSRSPEIQVCTRTQVLTQLVPTEDSNLAVLERWTKKKDHYIGSPEIHGSRPVLKLNQFVVCEDSQVDNSTHLEAEHSSPTDSQMEVDKATKNFQSLMKEFRLNLATVTQAFLKNSGELEATKYFLKNGVRPDGYPIWTRQDDLQLMNENDELKINLNNKFGTDNVKKRIAFLKS